MAAFLVAVLAACTSSGSHQGPAPSSSPSPTETRIALPRCPHRVPTEVRNDAAPRSRLVWPDPSIGRLCRYYPRLGLQGKGVPHGTLYGQAQLDAATATHFAKLLNAMPSPAAGERIACPAAFGTDDLLIFGYFDHASVEVLASADGCPSFTNGHYRTGDFSPTYGRYVRLVKKLVPTKRQVVEKSLLRKEKLS